MDADEALEAEVERDAAVSNAVQQQAINNKLQQQLQDLQKATAAAEKKTAKSQQQLVTQQQHAAVTSLPPTEQQALEDWAMDFPAEESQVPTWSGTPDEQQTSFLLRLLTLWQAAKFSSLPRMTFQELKVDPWFVHRLVGDEIWAVCWKDRAPSVANDMTIPQKMLNIITHIVATADNELRNQATDEQRTEAAATIAERWEAQKKRRET